MLGRPLSHCPIFVLSQRLGFVRKESFFLDYLAATKKLGKFLLAFGSFDLPSPSEQSVFAFFLIYVLIQSSVASVESLNSLLLSSFISSVFISLVNSHSLVWFFKRHLLLFYRLRTSFLSTMFRLV